MILLALLGILLISPAYAQSATVAVFAPSAADPNTATPLASPVTYTPTCNLAPFAETPPITNPIEGYFSDPANTSRDCVVDVRTQMAALPAGTGYRGAVKVGTGPYGPFSTSFAVSAAQTTPHPCDGTAPTSGTVVEGTRTLSWCWNGLDANGSATTVTSWALYTNGVRSVVSGVTAGTTANAAGQRLYSANIATVRGTRTYEVAAVNAVGEAPRSPVFTATVQAPPAVPSGAVIRGIQ